ARGVDLGPGQLGGVGQGLGGEGLHRVTVRGKVVGLHDGAAVPVEAEPAESVDAGLDRAGLDAGSVQVLDAEDDPPSVPAGRGPVDQEGSGVAEVQGAGGGGGESCGVAHRGYGNPNRLRTVCCRVSASKVHSVPAAGASGPGASQGTPM